MYRSQQQQNRLNSSNKIVNKPNIMMVSNNRRLSSGLFDTNMNTNTNINTNTNTNTNMNTNTNTNTNIGGNTNTKGNIRSKGVVSRK